MELELELITEPSRLKANPHFKHVLLYSKDNIKIPVAFSERHIPKDSIPAEVLSFIDYVDSVLNIARKMFETVYIKISKSSIKKISKKQRIYVPSDIILVGHIKDLEVAIMPSRGELYVEIRDKNSKKVNHSYRVSECCVKEHLKTLYSFFIERICK